jgi:integrase
LVLLLFARRPQRKLLTLSSLEARGVEPLSFHSLRRTATTILHEAGVPAAVAQALIGHDSEAMHELYVSVGREALQKAAEALPEI